MYSLTMPRSKSGFTIIEVLVVVVIMTILATVATVAYIGYQNQSRSSAANSLARVMSSALEQYFTKNNEYPDPHLLLPSGVTNGTTMTDYSAASSVLGVSNSSFQTNGWSFAVCMVSDTQCTANQAAKVYYLTPIPASNTTPYAYAIGSSGCQITLTEPSGGSGAQVYGLTYFDPASSKWTTYAGAKGSVATTDSINCPVIGL